MKLSRLCTAAAAAGVLMVTQAVGPASAGVYDMACNADFHTFNACLNFDEPVLNSMDAYVGLDALWPEQYAREIVALGTGAHASLWWDNGNNDRHVADLTLLPGSPQAESDRVSIRLVARGLSRAGLDFHPPANDEESFYAKVTYVDSHNGHTYEYVTGTVRGEFKERWEEPPCPTACS
jgi:hypothetical protein